MKKYAGVFLVIGIIAVILFLFLQNPMDFSVTGSDLIEIDTRIVCDTVQQCRDNEELVEISKIVYCDGTCKYRINDQRGVVYE